MLMLSRKTGETIIINGNIKITIANVNGSQVRLAIDAPKEISVNREEIQIQKDQNKGKIPKYDTRRRTVTPG